MTTDRDFDSTAYGRGYKDGKRDADAEIARLKEEVRGCGRRWRRSPRKVALTLRAASP